MLVALNVLVWVFVPDWSVRALILAVSLLAAPVLHTDAVPRDERFPVSDHLELLPAVDIADGQAVQLVQGVAGSEKRFGDPVEAALRWQEAGRGVDPPRRPRRRVRARRTTASCWPRSSAPSTSTWR